MRLKLHTKADQKIIEVIKKVYLDEHLSNDTLILKQLLKVFKRKFNKNIPQKLLNPFIDILQILSKKMQKEIGLDSIDLSFFSFICKHSRIIVCSLSLVELKMRENEVQRLISLHLKNILDFNSIEIKCLLVKQLFLLLPLPSKSTSEPYMFLLFAQVEAASYFLSIFRTHFLRIKQSDDNNNGTISPREFENADGKPTNRNDTSTYLLSILGILLRYTLYHQKFQHRQQQLLYNEMSKLLDSSLAADLIEFIGCLKEPCRKEVRFSISILVNLFVFNSKRMKIQKQNTKSSLINKYRSCNIEYKLATTAILRHLMSFLERTAEQAHNPIFLKDIQLGAMLILTKLVVYLEKPLNDLKIVLVLVEPLIGEEILFQELRRKLEVRETKEATYISEVNRFTETVGIIPVTCISELLDQFEVSPSKYFSTILDLVSRSEYKAIDKDLLERLVNLLFFVTSLKCRLSLKEKQILSSELLRLQLDYPLPERIRMKLFFKLSDLVGIEQKEAIYSLAKRNSKNFNEVLLRDFANTSHNSCDFETILKLKVLLLLQQ